MIANASARPIVQNYFVLRFTAEASCNLLLDAQWPRRHLRRFTGLSCPLRMHAPLLAAANLTFARSDGNLSRLTFHQCSKAV